MLQQNRMLDNCVNIFHNNKLNLKAKDQNSKNENNRCITLPYVGNASLVFNKALITQFKGINYLCNANFRALNYFQYNFFFNDGCDSLSQCCPLF